MGLGFNADFQIGGSLELNAGLNTPSKNPGSRVDPYLAYNFLVEIDGLIVGGFTEVAGLSIQAEVEPKVFGGENDVEYKFIKNIKYPDLTLKQGMTDSDVLWNWYEDVIHGKVKLRSGSIYLLDRLKNQVLGWNFFDATPVKWDGPVFNASSNTVATETLVLSHRGLKRIKKSSAQTSNTLELSGGISVSGSVSFSIGI